MDAVNLNNRLTVSFYSIERILERYERYAYAEKALAASDPESQVQTGSEL